MKKEEEKPLELMPVSCEMKVIDGILTPEGLMNKVRLDTFLKQLKENHRVIVTYELLNDNGSYAQLSKIHACIKEVASYTGHSAQEIKDLIKDKAHLYSEPGKLKSFANCSKSELSDAIRAVLELGDSLGCNLQQL